MNSVESLEKLSGAVGGEKKNANHPRYDLNYMLEKQKKKDDRFKEKTEKRAEELKAKSNILWNKIEAGRRHKWQGSITEE